MKPFKFILLIAFLSASLFVQAQQVTRLTLDQAVEYAKKNAAELKNAELAIRHSEQEVKSVISIGLPQLTASYNFTHNPQVASLQFPDFISPAVYGVLINEGLLGQDKFRAGESQTVQFGAPSSMTGMVSLNQLVFDGTYILGLKAAKEYVKVSELLMDMSEATLIESVQKAFYGALIGEANLTLINLSYDQLSKTLEDTKVLYSTGYAEQVDVDRLQLRLTRLQAQIRNLELQNTIMPGAGVDLPLIQLYGDVTDAYVQPKSNFSRPYDMVFNATRGTDLRKIYGDIEKHVKGGITAHTGYQALTTPTVMHCIAKTHAEGIGPWKSSLVDPASLEASPFLQAALDAGLHIHPYTFRAEETFLVSRPDGSLMSIADEIQLALRLGIHGFFTDYPNEGVAARDSFLKARQGATKNLKE